MAKKTVNLLDINQLETSLVDFMNNYNLITPENFPQATPKALGEFQLAYPALFKTSSLWSIDRHRKRFMDWMLMHNQPNR